jgi:hypothetical protein
LPSFLSLTGEDDSKKIPLQVLHRFVRLRKQKLSPLTSVCVAPFV